MRHEEVRQKLIQSRSVRIEASTARGYRTTHICPVVAQEPRGISVVVVDGVHERGHAGQVDSVHMSTVLEEVLQDL